ncbi:MAG: DUF5615 family PIN-like protein [Chloroflexi bacterium]|nr:DUF5615 family PIN-like protein [Chloroflexota bacterium]
MSKPKLHIDADASSKILVKALGERGHDVTRTPNEWIVEDADDEVQLTEATQRGRIIFTFNIKDFMPLAQEHAHAGILLAEQNAWTLSGLIHSVDRVLSETSAEEWIGQVRWLNQWR